MKKVLLCLAAFVFSFLAVIVPHTVGSSYAEPINNKVVHSSYKNNYVSDIAINNLNNVWFNFNFDTVTAINVNKISRLGDDTFYIDGSNFYILGSGFIWTSYTFNGLAPQNAYSFWTDGTDWYYSNNGYTYLRNPDNSWTPVNFSGITTFSGQWIYNFGDITLMYHNNSWYKLNGRVWSYIAVDYSYLDLYNIDFTVANNTLFVVNDLLVYALPSVLSPTERFFYFDTATNSFKILGSTAFDGNYVIPNFWSDGYNVYTGSYKVNTDTLGSWYIESRVDFIINNASYMTSSFNSQYVWSDGNFIFYSDGITNHNAFLLNNFYYSGYNEGYTDGYTAGYNSGVAAGSSSGAYDSGYNAGYSAGYNAGVNTNSGYDSGYNAGYDVGYNVGYDTGYSGGNTAGYNNGYTTGRAEGYNEGVEAANEYTFLGLIGAAIDAPIQAFTGLFSFDLLGVNIKNLLLTLFTFSVAIVIMKMLMAGK